MKIPEAYKIEYRVIHQDKLRFFFWFIIFVLILLGGAVSFAHASNYSSRYPADALTATLELLNDGGEGYLLYPCSSESIPPCSERTILNVTIDEYTDKIDIAAPASSIVCDSLDEAYVLGQGEYDIYLEPTSGNLYGQDHLDRDMVVNCTGSVSLITGNHGSQGYTFATVTYVPYDLRNSEADAYRNQQADLAIGIFMLLFIASFVLMFFSRTKKKGGDN